MKVQVIDAQIMWVSNYRDPITKNLNWVPVIGHPCERVPIPLTQESNTI